MFCKCPGGGIGRHKGLKIPRRKLRAGSSPAPGTNINKIFMRLTKRLIQANRATKQFIVAGTDFFLFLLSLWVTLSTSLTILFIPSLEEALSLFIFPVFGVLIFYITGVYRSVVRLSLIHI